MKAFYLGLFRVGKGYPRIPISSRNGESLPQKVGIGRAEVLSKSSTPSAYEYEEPPQCNAGS